MRRSDPHLTPAAGCGSAYGPLGQAWAVRSLIPLTTHTPIVCTHVCTQTHRSIGERPVCRARHVIARIPRMERSETGAPRRLMGLFSCAHGGCQEWNAPQRRRRGCAGERPRATLSPVSAQAPLKTPLTHAAQCIIHDRQLRRWIDRRATYQPKEIHS